MEIALSTIERMNVKPNHTSYSPVGSPAAFMSAENIRTKWLEICGDLMRPAKRDRFTGFKYHTVTTNLWRVEWYNAYRSYLSGNLSLAEAWAIVIKGGEIEAAIGDRPGLGTASSALNAFNWSDWERSNFFIVAMNDASMTAEQLSRLGRRTYPVAQPLDDGDVVDPHDRVEAGWIMPHFRIDYINGMGMSARSLEDIANVDLILHPRLDLLVNPNLLSVVEVPV